MIPLPTKSGSQRVWLIGLYWIWILAATPKPAAFSFAERLYDAYGLEMSGFVEIRQGWRTQEDPYQEEQSISEARARLELTRDGDLALIQFKGDLVADGVEDEVRGELREFSIAFSPAEAADIKMGRQTLTWGTGDLLFINDLFPKDWQSFFIGRDDEYLKAPADAAKVSLFFPWVNVDVVYGPYLNNSNYIDGSRLSYWNPLLGRRAGADDILRDHERDQLIKESEVAWRVSQTTKGIEWAFYGYHGFWKTPEGLDPSTGRLIYPRLSTYGASVRGPLLGGIANLEVGYYDSRQDSQGKDPLIRNSEFRLMGGFEREIGKNLTGSLQYYVEWMDDYRAYRESLSNGPARDEVRQVITLRMTKLLKNQTLRLSLFAYYSPTDQDAYLRPKIHYNITDAWTAETGANLFLGEEEHTFFGQFEKNSNIYASLRWHF